MSDLLLSSGVVRAQAREGRRLKVQLMSSFSRGCHDPMGAALVRLFDMRVRGRVLWASLLQMAVREASEMTSWWAVA